MFILVSVHETNRNVWAHEGLECPSSAISWTNMQGVGSLWNHRRWTKSLPTRCRAIYVIPACISSMAMCMWSGCSVSRLTAGLLEYTNELLPVLARSLPSGKARSCWRENWVRTTWALIFWAHKGCLLPVPRTYRLGALGTASPAEADLRSSAEGSEIMQEAQTCQDGTGTEWLSSLLLELNRSCPFPPRFILAIWPIVLFKCWFLCQLILFKNSC